MEGLQQHLALADAWIVIGDKATELSVRRRRKLFKDLALHPVNDFLGDRQQPVGPRPQKLRGVPARGFTCPLPVGGRFQGEGVTA